MITKQISIRWADLEHAFGDTRSTRDGVLFFERSTGYVRRLSGASVDRARAEPGVWAEISYCPPHEQFRWVAEYASTVGDERLCEEIARRLRGPGAFRRFRDLLACLPDEAERYHRIRCARLHEAIDRWLDQHEIATVEPPPWRAATDARREIFALVAALQEEQLGQVLEVVRLLHRRGAV